MIRAFLFAALLLFQQELPNQDDGDSGEANRPASCDNFKQTAPDHRCACARAMQHCGDMPQPPADVRMDKKCLTYCSAQHCRCAGSQCRS